MAGGAVMSNVEKFKLLKANPANYEVNALAREALSYAKGEVTSQVPWPFVTPLKIGDLVTINVRFRQGDSPPKKIPICQVRVTYVKKTRRSKAKRYRDFCGDFFEIRTLPVANFME